MAVKIEPSSERAQAQIKGVSKYKVITYCMLHQVLHVMYSNIM